MFLFFLWTLQLSCVHHLDVLKRLPLDAINALHLFLNVEYWCRKNALLSSTCRIAFSSSFRQNTRFVELSFSGHFLPRFSSAILFLVSWRSISANVFSTKFIFGLNDAWIGPSGNVHVQLIFGTLHAIPLTGVFNVACGFVHGFPGYCVHLSLPMCRFSSASGCVPRQALS